MDGATAPARGWVLPGCLFALCFCWAVVVDGALPALARAEGPPPPCPGPVLEISEEMPQPDREVRGLRNDLREACATLDGRLAEAVDVLGQVHSQLEALHGITANLQTVQQQQVEVDEESRGHLKDAADRLGATLVVESPGGVEVSNPTDVAGVEAAVQQDSETFNSTSWAIFGLIVGFGALAVVYKLVRP